MTHPIYNYKGNSKTSPLNGLGGVPPNSPNFNPVDGNMMRAIISSWMRERYPDSATYKSGNVLYYPEMEVSPVILTPGLPEENGIYVAETNRNANNYETQGTFKLLEKDINNVEPQVDEDSIDDLIDDSFSFFVDEPEDEEVVEIAEPENDIFITQKSTELEDCHAMYLEMGPGAPNRPIDPNTFCVFYIDQGRARPIPNYETLEVMLVERQIGYESIRLATEGEIELYGLQGRLAAPNEGTSPLGSTLQYEFSRMPDRYQQWNLQIRFDSGYRPVAPFLRDPGDYFDPDNVNDLGTPYESLVYNEQSSIEKMRDKYEGKMVVYNVTYGKVDDVPNTIIDADINSVRIMTLGYWKLPIELETYRAYNELMDIGAQPPNENFHINWLDRFNKAGFLTAFQGGSGGQFISGWNDFPHIAGADTLDQAEYNEYFTNVGGDVFSIDYLEPYEPRGSIQYYSAELSPELRAQALAAIQELEDDYQEQQAINAMKETLREEWKDLKAKVQSSINSLSVTFSDIAGIKEARDKAGSIRDDLMSYWYPSSGKWGYYRKRRFGSGDRKKGDSYGFWKMIEDKMRNSHEKECIKAYIMSLNDFDVAAPVDNSIQTKLLLPATEMTNKSDINKQIRKAGEVVAQYLDSMLGSLVPGGGGHFGFGAQIKQAWGDLKEKVKGIFAGIGNTIDDLAQLFGRFDIADIYTEKSMIRKQISTYNRSQPWGTSTKQVFTEQEQEDYGYQYYSSPIYGKMTPFDESIENIIGSEDYVEARDEVLNDLTWRKSKCNMAIGEIDSAGNLITMDQLIDLSERLAGRTLGFEQLNQNLPIPAPETMQEMLNIVGKRWIAKSHNTVQTVRSEFRRSRKKFFIRYNSRSKGIVKKYFPNISSTHFKDKTYKQIPYDTI